MASGPMMMESELGCALATTGTSNAWSTLDAVAKKVEKRLGRKVEPRDLDAFMVGVGPATLQQYVLFVLGTIRDLTRAGTLI